MNFYTVVNKNIVIQHLLYIDFQSTVFLMQVNIYNNWKILTFLNGIISFVKNLVITKMIKEQQCVICKFCHTFLTPSPFFLLKLSTGLPLQTLLFSGMTKFTGSHSSIVAKQIRLKKKNCKHCLTLINALKALAIYRV